VGVCLNIPIQLSMTNIGIGDDEFEVSAGDVVFIPEGVPHWYQNIGDENFEFLCIIPNKPDEIKLIGKEC
jgi:quercetin dioxygenase-like cupin family protein